MERSTHESPRGPGHETRDVALRPVLYGGIGLVAITAFFFALMWVLFAFYQERSTATEAAPHPLASQYAREQPPEPRLQSVPRDDLLALHAWEDGVLGTYAWVDRVEGIARVPVDRAMELFVARKMTGAPLADLHAAGEAR